MLTSLVRRALRSFAAPSNNESRLPMCVPEWSESMAERHAAIWWRVKPYTMTSAERVVAMCQSIAYLENRGIGGAIVECGVWKGGSIMAAALALASMRSTQRELFLFDTFTGMTEPGDVDVDWQGRSAHALLAADSGSIRAACSLAEVKQAMMLTRYPWEKLMFVPGRVEDTLPANVPAKIALLRLDTDWYESTYHELEHLYPRLVDGGVLIVDDYGHWQGAKKAVDDYFRRQGISPELRTIDFTGRLLVKKSSEVLAMKAA